MFRVQGEEIAPGLIRIWVNTSTARELERIVGSLKPEDLGLVIATAAAEQNEGQGHQAQPREQAVPLTLTTESYKVLVATFPSAVSDEHMAQLLIGRLNK